MNAAVRVTHRPLTVAALLLSMFMSAMEATVVATAMPTVIAELGGLAVYGWVGAAYLLASTVTVPLYGKLADRSGRKPVLMLGIVLFLLGSLASGLATTIEQLIVFRALQGLGAGAMQPVTMTIIGDLYTPAERGKVQGYFGAVWGIAGISGPLLGGAIVAAASWRWVFLINLPFGIAGAMVLASWYHEEPRARATSPLDWKGALAITLSSIALLLAASRIAPVASLVVGLSLLIAFVALELRAPDPVVPIPLLRRRLIAVGTLASLLLGVAMMGTLNYLPLHVQGVLGGRAVDAGIVIAPMLVGWPIASAATSKLLMRTGYRLPAVLGGVLAAGGMSAVAVLVAMRSPAPAIAVAMLFFGLGMGLANSAIVIALQGSVGWAQRGTVTALAMFARTMGGAMGVGALGAVLAARLTGRLSPEVVTRLLSPEGRGEIGSDAAVVDALGVAIDPIFVVTALAAIAGFFVLLMHPKDVSPSSPPAASSPPAPSPELRSAH